MTSQKVATKKITLATVKSFVKKNADKLAINVKSKFDSMTDGCETVKSGFMPAEKSEKFIDMTMGIKGAWFVGDSRDYFTPFEDEQRVGISVSNCCGAFILAINK